MRCFLFSIILFFAGRSFAQTMITDTSYFNRLYGQGAAHVLLQDSLARQKPGPLPVHFADTLKKYDWICLQNVDAHGFMNNFFAASPQNGSYYTLLRYDSVVSRYLITNKTDYTAMDFLGADGMFKGVLQNSDSSLLLMEVYNKNNWSGEDYRQYERRHIISYSNRVMVIDQLDYTQQGKPIIFRSAYLAIERLSR